MAYRYFASTLTTVDVAAAFISNNGCLVKFNYTKLPECRKATTPSMAAANADTKYTGITCEEVKGFIDLACGKVRQTKDGNWVLTLRTMNRKVKDGSYYGDKLDKIDENQWKNGFVVGEYQYRTYRLDMREDDAGIDLESLVVFAGSKLGWVKVFPNYKKVISVDATPLEVMA